MSFDRVAGLFAPLELLAFQGAMQKARRAHLEALDASKVALVLGEGDGRFLAALAKHRREKEIFVPLQVFVIEDARAMRERLQRRLSPLLDAARMRLVVHEDLGQLSDNHGPFDAVVTCFFLDCFGPSTLDELIPDLAARLGEDGVWLFADFQIPPRGWPALHARAWSWILHRFFRATAGIEAQGLAHFAARLGAAGLQLVPTQHQTFRFEFIRSDVWRHRERLRSADRA